MILLASGNFCLFMFFGFGFDYFWMLLITFFKFMLLCYLQWALTLAYNHCYVMGLSIVVCRNLMLFFFFLDIDYRWGD